MRSALPTRSRVTAIRSDDARPWISFRQAPGVWRGPRDLEEEAAPQLRVDARRGQPRRRALAVEREVRPHRARHAVRLGQLGHEGRAALDVDLQREDVARRRPAHAVRAAEQLRRSAPLGGGHEPPEQGVLLQALAAVLLGAGVVERLPDLPVGVGVAQQAVQFAAEVLELGVARLGRRHEGGHDGVLGPHLRRFPFSSAHRTPKPAVFF